MIRQGDIYWVDDGEPDGSEPGFNRPHVVVQCDFYNERRIETVLTCALSTNLRRAESEENLLLEAGEANLPKQSVVLAGQVVTVDKTLLGDYIGTLSAARVRQIVDGLTLLITPRPADDKA